MKTWRNALINNKKYIALLIISSILIFISIIAFHIITGFLGTVISALLISSSFLILSTMMSLILTSIRRQERENLRTNKSILKNQSAGLKYSSQTEYRTRNYRLNETLIQKLVEKVETLESKIENIHEIKNHHNLYESSNLNSRDEPINAQKNIFSPNYIKAITPEKNSDSLAGRHAAAVAEDPRLNEILELLVYSTPTEKKASQQATVSLLGHSNLSQALDREFNVIHLMPSYIKIPEDTSYVVIDLQETRQGPWYNLLDSSKTSAYISLANEITDARRRGVVAIMIDDKKNWGNFGFDLSSRVDVVISDENSYSNFESWSDDISTPLFDSLRRYIQAQVEVGA